MTSPHRLLSRGLAVAGILAFTGLLWLAIVSPLRTWRSETIRRVDELRQGIDRLDQSLLALARERAMLASSPDIGLIWKADQSGQASALIQSKLSEVARQTGLSLRSITPLPPREIPLAQGIGFRVELEAPLDRLVLFLIEIEHSLPFLSIDRASLRRLVRPVADNEGPVLPELFVQLDILAPVQLTQPLAGDKS